MKEILLVASLIYSSFLGAANVTLERLENTNLYFFYIDGQINQEDGQRFKQVSQNIKKAVVILNSPGGSVLGGLEIGRIIRENKFYTAVPNKTVCVSSCALIWLAGEKRFAETDSFVGFHAAYIYRNGVPVESGSGNALVGAYLNQIGLTDQAIMFITNAPPEGMARLDKKFSQLYGINYYSVSDSENKDITTQKQNIASDPEKSIGVVTRFYGALSRADGDTAAALVIPAKRGIGPFNEKRIATYFGNMKEPLVVNGIREIGMNKFEVNYTYRITNSQCKGVSIVETEDFLGNNFIKRIKANC